jgi:ribosome biogenesis GTPase
MSDGGSLHDGVVVAGHRSRIVVEDAQHNTVSCRADRTAEPVVVGDHVQWRANAAGHGAIENVLARRTLLSRSTPSGTTRPVAANVDLLVVVVAPRPKFSERLIDRYLIVAEYSGIRATLVLNKTDLLDHESQRDAASLLAAYERIGYVVHWLSAKENQGIGALEDTLRGRLAVLGGQSGVGKSSLMRLLTTTTDIEVGELSRRGNMGRHTTSASRLYRTSAGGHIIDTPGVQDFALWHVPPERIDQCFVEFHPYLGQCRFRDCRHLEEPGCAIDEAHANGFISAARLTSYRTMRTETRGD